MFDLTNDAHARGQGGLEFCLQFGDKNLVKIDHPPWVWLLFSTCKGDISNLEISPSSPIL